MSSDSANAEGRIVRSGERLPAWPGGFGEGLEVGDEGELRVVALGPGYLEADAQAVLRVAPVVRISADRVEAALDLRSAVGDEAPLTHAEVTDALEQLGVGHALDTGRVAAAWRIFEARGELLRPMRVARGEAPRVGRLARIELAPEVQLHVDAEGDAVEGRIDHHERGGVINVVAGQLLGTWIPGEPSEPGIGVDGEVLEVPASERSKPLRVGKNVECIEATDGSVRLEAAEGGIFLFDGGVPAVSLVLTIDGDVDLETGNIDAAGSVVVKGAVRPGFRVKARDGLVVHGIVEGADLISGADMELRKGLIGSEDTKVIVAGTLRIKYAQNAHLEVRGDIELGDSDMGSKILCSGRLRAASGRGRLRGGEYSAACGIRAKELGSELGALTCASVGTDDLFERDRSVFSDRMEAIKRELRKAKRLAKKSGGFAERKQEKRRRELQKEEASLRTKLAALSSERASLVEPPEIRILSSIYFGAELEINSSRLRPSETTGGRVFVFDPATASLLARSL